MATTNTITDTRRDRQAGSVSQTYTQQPPPAVLTAPPTTNPPHRPTWVVSPVHADEAQILMELRPVHDRPT